MSAGNAVYFEDKWPHLPVAVRINGHLLPLVGGEPVTVTAGENEITQVNVTAFAPGIEFIRVASEEAVELRSAAYVSLDGSK